MPKQSKRVYFLQKLNLLQMTYLQPRSCLDAGQGLGIGEKKYPIFNMKKPSKI